MGKQGTRRLVQATDDDDEPQAADDDNMAKESISAQGAFIKIDDIRHQYGLGSVKAKYAPTAEQEAFSCTSGPTGQVGQNLVCCPTQRLP